MFEFNECNAQKNKYTKHLHWINVYFDTQKMRQRVFWHNEIICRRNVMDTRMIHKKTWEKNNCPMVVHPCKSRKWYGCANVLPDTENLFYGYLREIKFDMCSVASMLSQLTEKRRRTSWDIFARNVNLCYFFCECCCFSSYIAAAYEYIKCSMIIIIMNYNKI